MKNDDFKVWVPNCKYLKVDSNHISTNEECGESIVENRRQISEIVRIRTNSYLG